jgi:5-oxoprolinase (ATP-hydrolysing)
VLRALAPVLPERVTTGNSAHIHFVSYSGYVSGQGEYWVYLEVDEGSYGGRPRGDGMDSVDNLSSQTRATIRSRSSNGVSRCAPSATSYATSRARRVSGGGIGIVRLNRFLTDTLVTCEGERHESDPPWGVFGGHEGCNGSLVRNPGTDGEERWPSKVTGFRLDAGDCLQITVPSAGGYGDPFERDPDRVRADVLDGFTTLELAESDYGVVLDPRTPAVDGPATERHRTERPAPETVSR